MVCPHGQGVEPVRTFCGQGGSIFRDFVRTSFMDGPLLYTVAYSTFVTFIPRYHLANLIVLRRLSEFIIFDSLFFYCST